MTNHCISYAGYDKYIMLQTKFRISNPKSVSKCETGGYLEQHCAFGDILMSNISDGVIDNVIKFYSILVFTFSDGDDDDDVEDDDESHDDDDTVI